MNEILITDMTRCIPGSAIADRRLKGTWKKLPYEAAPLKGTLIQATAFANAPVVTLPLELRGWHHVWILLAHTHKFLTDFGISFKLTGDDAWTDFLSNTRPDRAFIQACYFKAALLDGQALQFRVPKAFHPSYTGSLAGVKLLPMSASEAETHQRTISRRRTLPIVADDDAHSHFYFRHSNKPEDLVQQVADFANSDITELAWEIMWGERKATFVDCNWDPEHPWGEGMQAHRELIKDGYDSDAIALDYARKLGLKIILEMRVQSGILEPPEEELWPADLWINSRPEFRCLDFDGTQLPHLSWAFPEVQEMLLGKIRELARKYRANGWNFIFHRCPPVIMFEKPVTEAFKAKHGIDMHSVKSDDERLTAARSRIIADFMKRIKTALNEDAAKDGRGTFSLRANVLGTRQHNLHFGLDVGLWAREQAIDVIVPYNWGSHLWGPEGKGWAPGRGDCDFDYFIDCTRGTQTKLYFNVRDYGRNWQGPKPPHWPPNQMIEDVKYYLSKGAQGLYCWDLWGRLLDPAVRYIYLRLGQTDKYDTLWQEAVNMNPVFAIQSVAGIRMDMYPPCYST